MQYNKREHGYSQYLFNYITDYARGIEKTVNDMEFIWQNRKNFKDDVDVQKVIDNYREETKRKVKDFLAYLEPLEDEDGKEEG